MAAVLSIFTVGELCAQPCSSLEIVSAVPTESRCMATGTIQVNVTGGSGSYNYKVTGPVNTNFTSSSLITGLVPGDYSVVIQDVVSNCLDTMNNVTVTGSYTDPRFSLNKTDVTCMNAANGTISLNDQSGGRSPFTYTIVAPSPDNVGVSNTTGSFTGLGGGDYSVELKDSCGGIQTRRVVVLGYNWWIQTVNGSRVNCSDASFDIRLVDSRGNVNTSGTAFNGFQYGVVNSPGDTTWYNSRTFTHPAGSKRIVPLVVKDNCGNIMSTSWLNPVFPSVANVVTVSNASCNSFSAQITGQTNLTNPTYCLYNSSNVQVACNSTGLFTGLTAGAYNIQIKDACFDTTILRNFTAQMPKPSLNANVTTTRVDCGHFNANVSGITNFTNPQFCLLDGTGAQIACNTTGAFSNLANGSYCITARDNCYDTTVSRCFTIQALVPSVAANITVTDEQCLDADVSIGAQTNLTNATFCLYDAANVQISCNSTGTFNNLPYGSYCMRIQNSAECYDTTIQRCFTLIRPRPSVAANITVTKYCNTIDLGIGGFVRIQNPQICLYDGSNNLVACNTTGTFTGLPYGTYCMYIKNDPACYDTTIQRCVTVVKSIPSVGAASITNKKCATFDVAITNQQNLTNPQFVLKNNAGATIATNTTGIFTNVPYGDYCIDVTNDPGCYNYSTSVCFSGVQATPTMNNPNVTGRNCNGYSASVTVNNMFSPTFTLTDALGNVQTNTTGSFSNIAYGTATITAYDACTNTTLTKTVSANPVAITYNVSAAPSCEFNTSKLTIKVTAGSGPYTVRVYDPYNNVLASGSGFGSNYTFTDLPALMFGEQYRVVVTDNCGRTLEKMVTPVVSTFNSDIHVVAKCPSGAYQNGSSEVTITVSSNLGIINPQIISKDGSPVSIPYNTGFSTFYKWNDLGPGTYVVQYNLPGSCNQKPNDTFVVGPYVYPELGRSASYQCDNNSFSVGAVVTGGAAPYQYEIIGSVPSSPSIIAGPQASPIFNINNGNTYSLVRLRAVDYCGNATLNDVSVLPLQNIVASSTADCAMATTTLKVDYVDNASYAWYYKTSSTDSVLVGNNYQYTIDTLTPDKIGTYVCVIDVNGGCLTRLAYHTLTGTCGSVLPGNLELYGSTQEARNYLNWNRYVGEPIQQYAIERKQGNDYITIGQVQTDLSMQAGFSFNDTHHDNKTQQYRVKAISVSGKYLYSNAVTLNRASMGALKVYPNPVADQVHIVVPANGAGRHKLFLYTAGGQLVYTTDKTVQAGEKIDIRRQPSMKTGLYLLRIIRQDNGEETVVKLLFD